MDQIIYAETIVFSCCVDTGFSGSFSTINCWILIGGNLISSSSIVDCEIDGCPPTFAYLFRFNNVNDFHKIRNLSSINGETEIYIIYDKNNKIHKFQLKNKRKVNNHLLNTLNLVENLVID